MISYKIIEHALLHYATRASIDIRFFITIISPANYHARLRILDRHTVIIDRCPLVSTWLFFEGLNTGICPKEGMLQRMLLEAVAQCDELIGARLDDMTAVEHQIIDSPEGSGSELLNISRKAPVAIRAIR